MITSPIDPATTYLHLKDGQAEMMPVDECFWPSVMAGERRLDGWLAAGFAWLPDDGSAGHSEVHPKGDEVHFCQAGVMSAVLEHENGDDVVNFHAGEVCVIPAGVWHHLRPREPSRVFTLTFGQGTEHRSRQARPEER